MFPHSYMYGSWPLRNPEDGAGHPRLALRDGAADTGAFKGMDLGSWASGKRWPYWGIWPKNCPKHTGRMPGNKLEIGFGMFWCRILPGQSTCGGRGSAGHFHSVHTESSILGTIAALSHHIYLCAALHVSWWDGEVPGAAACGAFSEQLIVSKMMSCATVRPADDYAHIIELSR